ncbi:Hpt domain-containing protein [Lacisediminimonas sp.]|uniref:Hpt domain-containing protein n=1 Tax=Lacisediminimonas sp. TaxID=3060582 RepID=UPI0027208572|nr:Hpt domain-containing protein [Lacisediminimonas sp.]MDO8298463.1 Hpt domain-containing protein [Lacisediminimonas sp.]
MSNAPVDMRFLAEMTDDDPAAMAEFLSNFEVSAQRTTLELRQACMAGLPLAAGDLAHRLKSAARWVGATHLGEICASLEKAGHAGQIELLRDLMVSFEEEMRIVRQVLDQR